MYLLYEMYSWGRLLQLSSFNIIYLNYLCRILSFKGGGEGVGKWRWEKYIYIGAEKLPTDYGSTGGLLSTSAPGFNDPHGPPPPDYSTVAANLDSTILRPSDPFLLIFGSSRGANKMQMS